MPGPGAEQQARAIVLRMLLSGTTAAMLVGGIVLLVRSQWLGRGFSPLSLTVLAIALAAATALLVSRAGLTLLQLRALELGAFGAVALYLAGLGHASLVEAASSGDAGLFLSAWRRTELHFVLLAVSYGILIPNVWWRTAAVATPIVAVPLALVGLLRARYPEAVAGLADTISVGNLASDAVMLLIAALLAVLSAYVMNRFFITAFEARDSNLYDLEEPIGSGGMGEVWRARQPTLARPAAVKIIRPEMLADGDSANVDRLIRRFEREAKATAALRSPHTVEIYDFGVTKDGNFFYSMEYLDGIDLDSMVKRFGPLPAERVIYLLLQACDSLADAHDHGLTHRDIKPANIIACRLGTNHDYVKLLDFGLVKTSAPVLADSATLTMDGATSGTPAYMAPEMATQEREVDGRADLYALGCVGYWLLTGKQVFDGDNPVALLVEHVKTEPVPPSRRTELEVPEELDRIILKCLAKDPAGRFQTAAELADALLSCKTGATWNRGRAKEWWDLHLPIQQSPRAAA